MFQSHDTARAAQPPHKTFTDITPPVASSLDQLSPPRAVAPDLLHVATNVATAIEQRRIARTIEYRELKAESWRNNLVGASLLGGAAVNFMVAPPIQFEYPFATGFAVVSSIIGVASVVLAARIISAAVKDRFRSESEDRCESSEGFERAEVARNSASARPELLEAGRRYLTLLSDSNGAQIIAKSLIGLTDCIVRLGVHSAESALLIRDIDTSLSPNYTDLPVQRMLGRIALDGVTDLSRHLEDPTDRHLLGQSVARLAQAGLSADREESVETATALYLAARALPSTNPAMRAELLAAGCSLTKRIDPIRENIENFLREILDAAPTESDAQCVEYDRVVLICQQYNIEP